MTKEQVFEVLSLLNAAYPNFEVTQEKINVWHRLMKDQDFEIIMRNTERYTLENRYPPSISDLRQREHEAYKSNILEQIAMWEREASGRR